MNEILYEGLLALGRTTLFLACAAVSATIVLRLTRARSSRVHRTAWFLVLLVGWLFPRMPIAVPWYEPTAEKSEIAMNAGGPDEKDALPNGNPLLLVNQQETDQDFAPLLEKQTDTPEFSNEIASLPAGDFIKIEPIEPIIEISNQPQEPNTHELRNDAHESLLGEASTPPMTTLADRAASTPETIVAAKPLIGVATSARSGFSFSSLPWRSALAIAWVVGILVAMLRWLIGYVRSIRQMSTALVPDETSQRQWKELLNEKGVTRDIPLRLTADMGPLLCRWPDGYELVVPVDLWASLDATARESIMRHELAHFQRGDVWKSLSMRLLALPHWFNPASWWAVRRFDQAAEWACDEAAVTGQTRQTDYARVLLALAESSAGGGSCHPAMSRWNLSARVRRLVNSSNIKDSLMKKAVLLLIAIGLFSFCLIRVDLVAKTPAPEPESGDVAIGEIPSDITPSDKSEPLTTKSEPFTNKSEPRPSGSGPKIPNTSKKPLPLGHGSVVDERGSSNGNILPSDFIVHQLKLYVDQLAQLELDLRNLRTELAVSQLALKRLVEKPVATLELERTKLRDQVCQDLQKKISELQTVQAQASGRARTSEKKTGFFDEQLSDQIHGLQEELNARHKKLSDLLTDAKKSELQENIADLSVKIELAEEAHNDLEHKVAKLRKQLKGTAQTSFATAPGATAGSPSSAPLDETSDDALDIIELSPVSDDGNVLQPESFTNKSEPRPSGSGPKSLDASKRPLPLGHGSEAGGYGSGAVELSPSKNDSDVQSDLLVHRLKLYLDQLAKLEIELRNLRVEHEVSQRALKRLEKKPIDILELERVKQKDPKCRDLEKKLGELQLALRQASSRKVNGKRIPLEKQLHEQADILQAELKDRHMYLSDGLTEVKKRELQEKIANLAVKIELAEEGHNDLEHKVAKLRKHAKERTPVQIEPMEEVSRSSIRVNQTFQGALKTSASQDPHEGAMVSLPEYRIEPPDVLNIELAKMAPIPPYHIAAYDVLQVDVMGTLLDQPIKSNYLVEADGNIHLGPAYGRVKVGGLTIKKAEKAVTNHLLQVLANPQVAIRLVKGSSYQPIKGPYLVGPDGTINLRQYGSVVVAGKTLTEAIKLLNRHLAKWFVTPKVSVDIASYNSKVYYIIIRTKNHGDHVTRFPITGNETVLDGISQFRGLRVLRGAEVWIARPQGDGKGKQIRIEVDYDSIVKGITTKTNYQLLPGDRLFIDGAVVEESTSPLVTMKSKSKAAKYSTVYPQGVTAIEGYPQGATPVIASSTPYYSSGKNFRYQGRSFDEWKQVLDTEVSPERLVDAMKAFAAIGTRGRSQEAAEQILRLMRTYGASSPYQSSTDSSVMQTAVDIFAGFALDRKHGTYEKTAHAIPLNVGLPALCRELEEGNQNSRAFVLYLIRHMYYQKGLLVEEDRHSSGDTRRIRDEYKALVPALGRFILRKDVGDLRHEALRRLLNPWSGFSPTAAKELRSTVHKLLKDRLDPKDILRLAEASSIAGSEYASIASLDTPGIAFPVADPKLNPLELTVDGKKILGDLVGLLNDSDKGIRRRAMGCLMHRLEQLAKAQTKSKRSLSKDAETALSTVTLQVVLKAKEHGLEFGAMLLNKFSVILQNESFAAWINEAAQNDDNEVLSQRAKELIKAVQRVEWQRKIQQQEKLAAKRKSSSSSTRSGRRPKKKKTTTSSAREILSYQNRGFDSWKRTLETDLSPERQVESIRALAMFGSRGYGKEAAEAIVRLMRLRGGKDPESTKVGSMAVAAFAHHARRAETLIDIIPPADGVAILCRELKEGNEKSRTFALHVLRKMELKAHEAIPCLTEFIRSKESKQHRIAAFKTLSAVDASGETYICICREVIDGATDPAEARDVLCNVSYTGINFVRLGQPRADGTNPAVARPLKLTNRNHRLLAMLTDYAMKKDSPVQVNALAYLSYSLNRLLVDLAPDQRKNSTLVILERLHDSWPELSDEVHETLHLPLRSLMTTYVGLDKKRQQMLQLDMKRLTRQPAFLFWVDDLQKSDDSELVKAVAIVFKEFPPKMSLMGQVAERLNPHRGPATTSLATPYTPAPKPRPKRKPRIDVSSWISIDGNNPYALVGDNAHLTIQVDNRTGTNLTKVKVRCHCNKVVRPVAATEGYQKEDDGAITWIVDSWPSGLARKFAIDVKSIAADKSAIFDVKVTSAESISGDTMADYRIRLPNPPEKRMVPIGEGDSPATKAKKTQPKAPSLASQSAFSTTIVFILSVMREDKTNKLLNILSSDIKNRRRQTILNELRELDFSKVKVKGTLQLGDGSQHCTLEPVPKKGAMTNKTWYTTNITFKPKGEAWIISRMEIDEFTMKEELAVNITLSGVTHSGETSIYTFAVQATNPGQIPLTNLKVAYRTNKQMPAVAASDGYRREGDLLVWTIDSLAPGKSTNLEIRCKKGTKPGTVRHHIKATTAEGVEAEDEYEIEIPKPPRKIVPIGGETGNVDGIPQLPLANANQKDTKATQSPGSSASSVFETAEDNKKPRCAPVSGLVTIDGRPLKCGTIRFLPNKGRPALAEIQPDGRYELTTFSKGDGATIGSHRIVIVATEKVDNNKKRWLVPKKYASTKTSGLTATVRDHKNVVNIELKWSGIKPFIKENDPRPSISIAKPRRPRASNKSEPRPSGSGISVVTNSPPPNSRGSEADMKSCYLVIMNDSGRPSRVVSQAWTKESTITDILKTFTRHQGLKLLSAKQLHETGIIISRPGVNGLPGQLLSVDTAAIAHDAEEAARWKLQPGDRVLVMPRGGKDIKFEMKGVLPHEGAMISPKTYRIAPPDVLEVKILLPEEKKVSVFESYYDKDSPNTPKVRSREVTQSSIKTEKGLYLVGPDGTINMRKHGSVKVAGLTIDEAAEAIEKQLGKDTKPVKVHVAIAANNSKVFYIITKGADNKGDNVIRIPNTGSETVLDALAAIQGISNLSDSRVWVMRRRNGKDSKLSVDLERIIKGEDTTTNYQLMPGDRIYIDNDSNSLIKSIKPYEPASRSRESA